ncbi:hypothetical protein [Sphingopyxis granuli]|uniref:hypothetical protein n=1 Tax=Sphingopyxis granuli TaxID=267128 RepID=UPI0011DFBFDA|nr:hypothetical protein [Sphingopyxis granuli]
MDFHAKAIRLFNDCGIRPRCLGELAPFLGMAARHAAWLSMKAARPKSERAMRRLARRDILGKSFQIAPNRGSGRAPFRMLPASQFAQTILNIILDPMISRL